MNYITSASQISIHFGKKSGPGPRWSPGKRLGRASFRNCLADAFGGALHGRDIQLLGDVLFRSSACAVDDGGRYMGMMTIYDNLVIFYRDFFRLLRWFFEQSWDLKEILNPGSNFHYRMVGLRSTQSCQSGYFIRNFGVGARYFVARGFRSHIMGRLGSSTAFCSDHVVDSDHDQSTKCSCKKSLLDDLRFCGAKSLLQNAPSKNWTLRASYETLFRIPPFL